jgi:hypothetical protein
MEKIYQQSNGNSDMYSKRINVDIPNDAMWIMIICFSTIEDKLIS